MNKWSIMIVKLFMKSHLIILNNSKKVYGESIIQKARA